MEPSQGSCEFAISGLLKMIFATIHHGMKARCGPQTPHALRQIKGRYRRPVQFEDVDICGASDDA
jgi:hypothetical protein